MDYNQESFLKPPFYMTYPMQNLFQAEMEYEKDMERMKEFYPAEVRKMLHCIEDQCDELEYEGSPMYDEYPDRLMFEKLADKIYEKWKTEELTLHQSWERVLLGVLLSDEIYRRRCRNRRCRRWW